MFFSANFFEMSRTAGLSSLLWHRNTSRLPHWSSVRSRRGNSIGEARADGNATSAIPHFNFFAYPDIEPKRPVPDDEVFALTYTLHL